MREFDLIVIGTGTAAAAVVRCCAKAGWHPLRRREGGKHFTPEAMPT